MPTKVSARGMRPSRRKLAHSKVPITTMNITPTRAAMGICSMSPEAKRMKASRNSAAAMPERRPRPPELQAVDGIAHALADALAVAAPAGLRELVDEGEGKQ